MRMKSTTRGGYAVAVTAAAVTGLSMFGMTTAQASPPPPTPPTCSAEDVTVSTNELPAPNDEERLYELVAHAKPDVGCIIEGGPANLTFYGPSGPLPIDVEMPAPGTGGQANIGGDTPAVAHLHGPKTEGPARATSVSFTLPGDDDVPLRTGWVRGGVDGPLRADNFTTLVK